MEYIPGVPLNKYCDDHELGLRARLDLFIQVCRGVQHAHQKGIIHRDLKPGNILVTEVEGKPVPKIIDFGVAKATGQHLAAQTMFTRMGQMIGTPEYMSPEQAGSSLADVDTRSDVYSLGVLLYELLTGVLPLERRDIMQAGLERMALHVQNEIPKKPSTRIDTEAQTKAGSTTVYGRDTRFWAKRIRGDLDWITMKALEKERERRYGSPADMAEDITRHLNNHPVEAGPPSGLYRLRKFVRRNRLGVLAGSIVAAALMVGIIGVSVGMVRAKRAESQALAAADRAEASTLYQLARSKKSPSLALPYIMGALERDDRMEYRLHAKQLLLQSPPHWRLPFPPDSHNPYSIDISPDGAWMAVGWSQGGSLQLYSLEGGEPVMLPGHQFNVWRVRFGPDSQYLLTTDSESRVRLWSPKDGELVREWRFTSDVVPFLDMAKNLLITQEAVLGEPIRWQAWPLNGGVPTELGTVGPPSDSDPSERPLPDLDPSRRWLVQPHGNSLDLFDLENLASGPVKTIGRHEVDITGAEFSPDGRTVASYDKEGTVKIWDLDSKQSEPARQLQANPMPIFIRFDHTGSRLAVSGLEGMKVWDLTLAETVKPLELRSSNWSFAGAFHPSGDWLVTTGTGRSVAAWPLVGEQPLVLDIAEENLGSMIFSPDGRHLILGSELGVIWDLPLDGRKIGEPNIIHTEEGFDYQVVQMDDASRNVFLVSCNASRGNGVVMQVPLDGGKAKYFWGFTCTFVVDSSGRYIASMAEHESGDYFVRIFDTATGEDRLLDEPLGGFSAVTGFMGDGRLLVRGPGGIGLWDNTRDDFFSVSRDMVSGWLAKDRKTIVFFSPEEDIWRQTEAGMNLEMLPLKFQPGRFFTFQMDSTASFLAGGFEGGAIQFLDMEAGQSYRYPLFEADASIVALDPKKRWIATTGFTDEGVVKLLSMPSGIPLEDLPYQDLMAKLNTLTNLRVEYDEEKEFGFKVIGRGVPDWNNPPSW